MFESFSEETTLIDVSIQPRRKILFSKENTKISFINSLHSRVFLAVLYFIANVIDTFRPEDSPFVLR